MVGAVCAAVIYVSWAMTFDLDQVGQMPQRSMVFDMDGNLYSRLHGENRILIPEGGMSEQFKNALLAREDSRFYRHGGIDPIGILRAMVRNILSGSVREGGSTITQQLAKNSYPLGGRTLHRKILEALVALRIERRYSKDEILLHYMNRIYYGAGLYGVETASLAYFDKPGKKLMAGEAALLAGLVRSPNRYSPFKNPGGAKRERDTVLGRMEKLEMLTPAAAAAARSAPLHIAASRPRSTQENYAMDAIRRDLDQILEEKLADEGGLRIYTTIDPKLQDAAAGALNSHLAKAERVAGFSHPRRDQFTPEQKAAEEATPYLQGALVVIDNRDGGVRALVGGRDYTESKFNRAILSRRQIGSSFKPFVYAAAFDRAMLPGHRMSDAPIGPDEIRSVRTNWSPGNSDGQNRGMLPASEGLVQSRNTMSVRVGELAGLDLVREYGVRAGLGEEIPHLPAIYLGAFEATLKDLTTAYTVFPNAGIRRQSYLIERIDDSEGRRIYLAPRIAIQAIPADVAWMTSSVLREVVGHGTASDLGSLGFKKPAAGKTGTTNDYTDAWYLGYTTSLTCGVWVGLDSPKRIIAGGYGSRLAMPVWAATMKAASENRYAARDFQPPVRMARAVVCATSDRLATSGCRSAGTAYDADIPAERVPREVCPEHDGRLVNAPRRQDAPPSPLMRTFRKLFGGR